MCAYAGKSFTDGDGQPGEVARRRDLLGRRQAVGVDEMRAGHAQALGGGIHARHERLVRARHGLGQHHGGIVGRLDDEGLQRGLDADLRADGKPEPARSLAVRELGNGNLVLQVQLAAGDRLEHQVGGHDLGEGCRIPLVVLILGVEDPAGGRIEQQRRAGRGGRQRDRRGSGDRHQPPSQHVPTFSDPLPTGSLFMRPFRRPA